MLIFAIVGIVEIIICWLEYFIVRKDENKVMVRKEIIFQLILTFVILFNLYRLFDLTVIKIILVPMILIDTWRHVTLIDYCVKTIKINNIDREKANIKKKLTRNKARIDKLETDIEKIVMEELQELKDKNVQLDKYERLTELLDKYMLAKKQIEEDPELKYVKTELDIHEILVNIANELNDIAEKESSD